MNPLPWWALSPGPVTIAQWLVLSLYGFIKLKQRYSFTRVKSLYYFAETAFVIGFVVLLSDALWVFLQGWRFLPMFPDSFNQLAVCLVRDIAAFGLCFIFILELFKNKVLKLNFYFVFGWAWNIIFMVIWFTNSPSPAFTDYTFAIKNGFPWPVVWNTFLMSHGMGRLITGFIYWGLWN